MAVLVLGVTLGAAGTQMLAGRGLPEAVPPAYETRLTPGRPLSRDFVRLMETPPRAQVTQRDIAGTAEWDEPFAELVPLEDYPSDPKLVRLVMTP